MKITGNVDEQCQVHDCERPADAVLIFRHRVRRQTVGHQTAAYCAEHAIVMLRTTTDR